MAVSRAEVPLGSTYTLSHCTVVSQHYGNIQYLMTRLTDTYFVDKNRREGKAALFFLRKVQYQYCTSTSDKTLFFFEARLTY